MIGCTGTPAELYALPYVEGTLPQFEMERFEEHFFDCPVCLARLQALQAAGQALAHQPLAPLQDVRPAPLLAWPSRAWAWGAVAAVLVIGVLALRIVVTRPAQPTVARNTPAAAPKTPLAPQPESPSTPRASQLADLALPAFVASSLRGESPDPHFEAGMKAYSSGNCRAAIAPLSHVPETARESLAAQFYLGACQMHQGNLAAASAGLRKVAEAGDSPQQEAALYYLAQTALLDNDPVRAHRYLVHTIGLRGDIELRARAQDRQVTELIAQNYQSKATNPENRNK